MMGDLEEKVVSLGDSLLRRSDVELLEGPYWLNDNLISFYFEYLALHKYTDMDILFVGPEVTHCLKGSCKEDLPIFLDPVNARDKRYIFFAFNDHRAFAQSGGTHWSLMIYSAPDKTMFHADSMSSANFHQAGKLCAKVVQYLSPSGECDFEELTCLQQENSYDCGIFVLCHTEFYVENLKNGTSIRDSKLIPKSIVETKRKDILNLIKDVVEDSQTRL